MRIVMTIVVRGLSLIASGTAVPTAGMVVVVLEEKVRAGRKRGVLSE
jgi:hypothetical protein